jgi:hypothetical protein
MNKETIKHIAIRTINLQSTSIGELQHFIDDSFAERNEVFKK